ncbi:uncharacterized protein EV420DRAFT_1487188 [Desarmillaria tabescens]|uniref:Uncharacterized protein n=1 Tax=Armillaria tabescens TaxID=1929756 RepID=A0AA39ML01_ARMTA|nr:uncharacterized protein EV420DRAFT_1487188 [Desarmillaria tabescens]KAK0437285.1 hypothetical protein EV420DRAFT_1487188 [Desarmillaria tabescens]
MLAGVSSSSSSIPLLFLILCFYCHNRQPRPRSGRLSIWTCFNGRVYMGRESTTYTPDSLSTAQRQCSMGNKRVRKTSIRQNNTRYADQAQHLASAAKIYFRRWIPFCEVEEGSMMSSLKYHRVKNKGSIHYYRESEHEVEYLRATDATLQCTQRMERRGGAVEDALGADGWDGEALTGGCVERPGASGRRWSADIGCEVEQSPGGRQHVCQLVQTLECMQWGSSLK